MAPPQRDRKSYWLILHGNGDLKYDEMKLMKELKRLRIFLGGGDYNYIQFSRRCLSAQWTRLLIEGHHFKEVYIVY